MSPVSYQLLHPAVYHFKHLGGGGVPHRALDASDGAACPGAMESVSFLLNSGGPRPI